MTACESFWPTRLEWYNPEPSSEVVYSSYSILLHGEFRSGYGNGMFQLGSNQLLHFLQKSPSSGRGRIQEVYPGSQHNAISDPYLYTIVTLSWQHFWVQDNVSWVYVYSAHALVSEASSN